MQRRVTTVDPPAADGPPAAPTPDPADARVPTPRRTPRKRAAKPASDTAPPQSPPADTILADPAPPAEASPSDTAPADPAPPAEACPSDTAPVEAAPTAATPADAAPADRAPVEDGVAELVLVDVVAGEPVKRRRTRPANPDTSLSGSAARDGGSPDAAPVPAAPGVRQLSLFGVEARAPAAADLEGLLAGPGPVVRMGGPARVSIVVGDLWRAKVLVSEVRARGLVATCVATADQHIGVRSAYSTALAPLGRAWLRGAVKTPPEGFMLDGRQLRLWLTAVGTPDEQGFTLALGATDEPTWGAVGAALAALGLAPVLLGPRAGGPAYRIAGRRRLARLRELVGEAPADAPPGLWPA
jgi:hypothetical protein